MKRFKALFRLIAFIYIVMFVWDICSFSNKPLHLADRKKRRATLPHCTFKQVLQKAQNKKRKIMNIKDLALVALVVIVCLVSCGVRFSYLTPNYAKQCI